MEVGDRFVLELAARFDAIQERFEIIKRIDRAMIETDRSIDASIADILNSTAKHFRVESASAFLVVNGDLLEFPQPNAPFSPVALDDALRAQAAKCTELDIHTDDSNGRACLLLPISFGAVATLRVTLVYQASWYGGSRSQLHDKDLQSFARTVANQSGILLSKQLQARSHKARDEVEKGYFVDVTKSDPLSVPRRWYGLVTYFRNLLPDWPPLKIDPPPEIQILSWSGKDEIIMLRGGTKPGGAVPAKSLRINEAVCGIPIEEEIKATSLQRDSSASNSEEGDRVGFLLYDNPKNPKDPRVGKRYKTYLFPGKVPESELVIPIRWARNNESEKTVAVVNLEHLQDKVFSKAHIDVLVEGAQLIAPYAAALINEEAQQRSKDIAHTYMLHGILQKMATTYRHKIGQRIIAAKLSLEQLEGLSQRLDGDEKKLFERLDRSVRGFSDLSASFVEDLPNYVNFGEVDIIPLVKAALAEFDPSGMEKAENIFMTLQFSPETLADRSLKVFGSSLIREHVYNILNNCVYEVRSQLQSPHSKVKEGRIAIIIRLEDQKDESGTKVSFPFVVVRIEDNGGGLSDKIAINYGQFGNRSNKPGSSGYGVAAAREYLTTIGGQLRWSNYDTPKGIRGLWQELCFPKYVPDVHEEMSKQGYFWSQQSPEGKP